MRQTFTVTSPADDPSLLTIEQLRLAAGLADDDVSQDAKLTQLGLAISADLAVACNVEADGINQPTLREETITETLWLSDRPCEVLLSRCFVSSVTSATETDTALLTTDYVLDREAGIIKRVSDGRPWRWACGALSVVYVAGFDEVPADLAAIASDLVRIRLSSASRDPLVKGGTIEIPDVMTRRTDYWVGALPGGVSGAVPADILIRLSRYRRIAISS